MGESANRLRSTLCAPRSTHFHRWWCAAAHGHCSENKPLARWNVETLARYTLHVSSAVRRPACHFHPWWRAPRAHGVCFLLYDEKKRGSPETVAARLRQPHCHLPASACLGGVLIVILITSIPQIARKHNLGAIADAAPRLSTTLTHHLLYDILNDAKRKRA